MAKRMNAQLEGLDQATQNSNDGISIMQIADGALSEIHEMLQRINELSVKAATGTLTDDDRKIIDQEVKQLTEEIDRTASEVEFNGQRLLDGSFDLKAYTDDLDVKVAYYSDEVVSGAYTIADLEVEFDSEGKITDVKKVSTNIPGLNAYDSTQTDNGGTTVDWEEGGNLITIRGSQGTEIKLEVQEPEIIPPATTPPAIKTPVNVVIPGFGSLDMQIGSNEGQQLAARIPKVSTELMGIANVDLTTQEGAKKTIDKVKGAIQYVSSVRSRLGGCGYGGGNDRVYHPSGIVSGQHFYSGSGKREAGSGVAIIAVNLLVSILKVMKRGIKNDKGIEAGLYFEDCTGK